MCGIAGYMNGDPKKDLLKRMISQLEHRGPDGFGYYIDKNVGLAHARLSIIDLEGGAQPISNEDGTIWVTFNGEIYNYLELRSILEERGHVFKTKTDTEVIVHAYEEYGDSCVPLFNGQFAFALWDSEKERGLLARDRVGIQPLFYTSRFPTPGYDGRRTFYFASEIKALMAHPDLRKGLDRNQVANTFKYWAPALGDSVFEGVNELPPGCFIVVSGNHCSDVKTYWDHNFAQKYGVHGLDYHLGNSIDFRLRADVPVAAYLSGGLDSSIIARLASQRIGDKLNTFSIEFDDKQYDESDYQQRLAEWLGVNHTSFKCRRKDISDVFPRVVFHAEKPLFRTAPAPMYLLSKMVKNAGYKVVLTGEGADEVFAGYDIFREYVVRCAMLNQKFDTAYVNHMLTQLYPWMNRRMLTSSTDYMKVFFDSASKDPRELAFSHEPRFRSSSKAKAFFADEMYMSDERSYFTGMRVHGIDDGFARAQYIEWKTLFNGYLMSSQGDRMLMANGVEGRFPFLDPNVVDYGNSLPWTEKLHVDEQGNMDEKHVLKNCAEDNTWVPSYIWQRKKQPYMAPDAECFLSDDIVVPPYVDHLLSPDADYGYFNMRKVGFLRKKVESGRAKGFSDNMAFVGILSTQLLHWQMVESFQPIQTADDSRFNVAVEKLD